MPLGPVMLDVAGLELTADERRMLAHPLVGGIILFARNYESPSQLVALVASIRELRSPNLLISVDHEGGRVQRFRSGFTTIPPMRMLGALWKDNAERAVEAAGAIGCIIGTELQYHGIDFSFTPVLDVDFGLSSVIGDRAFSDNPAAIQVLAAALVEGLMAAGAAAVGKHFPGHGHVAADSHAELPVDDREWSSIESMDIQPYRGLIRKGLAAVMPAHVIYPRVDSHPAGFSAVWLKTILRGQLGFSGMIFSDDLSMKGAGVAGNICDRGRLALDSGCDMVLVCNDPAASMQLMDGLKAGPIDTTKADRMRGRHLSQPWPERYNQAIAIVHAMNS
ncbi:MAG: beta-N-acetylhexosaminidase [Betaproteobacteria bacterium]|nr:beta-N-acetylhexosaminidase [Betaproteobacteria bacterium]